MTESILLDQLRAAVSRLAAPPAQQVQYLRHINTHPSADELALEFHDLIVSRSRLRSQSGISNEVLSLVAALEEKLNSFSGAHHAEEWNVSALEDSPNWNEVRSLARQLLSALG